MTVKQVLLGIVSLCWSFIVLGQTCNNLIPHSTPTDRFTINSGGFTVTDNRTGLTWMRCTIGQSWNGSECTGSADKFSWQDALQYADSKTFATHSDWYLPNIKELASIKEEACFEPSINEVVFPNIPVGRIYWTSTPSANGDNDIWYILFDDGLEQNFAKPSFHHIRLVRKD